MFSVAIKCTFEFASVLSVKSFDAHRSGQGFANRDSWMDSRIGLTLKGLPLF